MRKIHRVSGVCFAMFLLLGSLFPSESQAHPDHLDSDVVERVYPFRQRIHELCSGHGATHLSDEELAWVLAKVGERFDEVLPLLEKADKENYLVQLTNMVRLSSATKSQKNQIYRGAYEKCKAKLDEGDEWSHAIRTLIQETSALTNDEIEAHLSADNQYLREAAEKALADRSRGERKGLRSESDQNEVGQDRAQENDQPKVGETLPDDQKSAPWALWSAVGLFIMALIVYLMRRRKHS